MQEEDVFNVYTSDQCESSLFNVALGLSIVLVEWINM